MHEEFAVALAEDPHLISLVVTPKNAKSLSNTSVGCLLVSSARPCKV
jgi:hypothetical protein